MQLIQDAPLLIATVSQFVGLVLLVRVSGEEQVGHLTYTLRASIKEMGENNELFSRLG